MANLTDRTIALTGGTGGLGRAVLAAMLSDGARVVASYIDEAEIERLDGGLAEHGSLELVRADLADESGALELARAAGERVDGLVCLAGGYAASGPLHEAPADELASLIELNLMTAHRAARAIVPAMLEGGGSIVLVGARAALEPFAGGGSYSVAKAGVIALARALAADYRDAGIRANSILPSVIDTPANRRASPDADHSRWVSPELIAGVVAWLVGPEAEPISGAALPVYGRA